MHLDDRQLGRLQGIEHGDRGVRVGPGVQDDAGALSRASWIQSTSSPFEFDLAKSIVAPPPWRGPRLRTTSQASPAVDRGLAQTQHIEVGSVEDVNRLGHHRSWRCRGGVASGISEKPVYQLSPGAERAAAARCADGCAGRIALGRGCRRATGGRLGTAISRAAAGLAQLRDVVLESSFRFSGAPGWSDRRRGNAACR